MPYMDETGLAYYSGKLKPWIASQPVKTLPSSLYPWTLSDKAGAVTCWPVGGTPLLPTVDFLFSETGPSSGTKGPDNPSTITGVSTITVTRCETVGVDSTDYTIDLNGTHYGGSIDLATGVMTVTWKRYVFNGTESWSVQSQAGNVIVFQSNAIAAGSMSVDPDENTRVCSHFPYAPSGSGYAGSFFTFGYSSTVFFRMDASLYPNAGAFKAFVLSQYNNGTPITLTYKVYTPTSIQLTPTQILSLAQTDKYTPRLNTIYTDASAVQVGYVKSPIREEFELQQAIVAQGGSI